MFRQVLYGPVLVAMPINSDLKRVCDRLIINGKYAKIAITVITRKLVIIVKAPLRDARL
ncbi:hypothetical protein [Brytella acorum]|uniref:Uncharacterized protein n=1 Tax=Brytella acorum TaxID=2959299 RepID=A0AA35V4D1_9PROT|nr:hypothetical protein [Brytella acorum]CAI9122396.1 hypothetical protein LMG32879_003262 [Brytella acorum]